MLLWFNFISGWIDLPTLTTSCGLSDNGKDSEYSIQWIFSDMFFTDSIFFYFLCVSYGLILCIISNGFYLIFCPGRSILGTSSILGISFFKKDFQQNTSSVILCGSFDNLHFRVWAIMSVDVQTIAWQHSDNISSNQIFDTRISFNREGAWTDVQDLLIIGHDHP